ncbi:sulfate ABC transporter permease subunit CysT [Dyella acidiphila]|uniref:Sulfate transport system permease protein CysT n=1 Tax=Dyella acidiphila TaxID=2775866 RepID=A0ABR9G8I8_9GAMM|nr:sulfate ABC transporter permease subunit CysT [Dyella acidiphila]MBE1160361.1 sulfate ABC transporter permease subunit CysT [Dyella acidiphila]
MTRHVLPGFRLSVGYTLAALGSCVLLPLAALVWTACELGPSGWWAQVGTRRVMASLRLSFGAALLAAVIDMVLGLLVAWVLVRYRFALRRLCDALVDLPFALPTAVAGIALTALYAPNGWLGSRLVPFGIEVAYTQLGVLLAMVFVGLPFVVRTLQPVLESLEHDLEEAAYILGASPAQRFFRVLLPLLWPTLLTGYALALARAIGEYGSVVFISGNRLFRTEITPYLIVQKIDSQYDYRGAAALGAVMLAASLLLLVAISAWQRRARRWARLR